MKPHLTLNQSFSSPGFGVSPSPWLCTARALHHSWHLRYDLKGADPMERSWRGRLRGQRERGSATWPPKRSRGSPVGSHGCTPGAVVTSVRGGCSPCPQQWLCLGPRDSPATPAWQDTRARGFFNLFLPVVFFFFKTGDRIWGKTSVPALTYPVRREPGGGCGGGSSPWVWLTALPISMACFKTKAGRSEDGERCIFRQEQ